MAGTFLENVRAAFLARNPSAHDRVASAAVKVSLSRKLLTSLVEVGLREALEKYAHVAKLDLEKLETTHQRRANIDAVVRLTVLDKVLDLRLVGDVEALPFLGNGLTLRFHHLAARGASRELDTFIADALQKYVLAPLRGTTLVIDSVRLACASVQSLTIRGDDVVEIIVSIRDAVATEAMGI